MIAIVLDMTSWKAESLGKRYMRIMKKTLLVLFGAMLVGAIGSAAIGGMLLRVEKRCVALS